MKITYKWNSWDASGINILSSSLTGLKVTYFFQKEARRLEEIRNHHLYRLKYYSIEYGYYEYEVQFEEAIISVRIVAMGKDIIFEFLPIRGAYDVLVGGKVTGSFGQSIHSTKRIDVINVIRGKEVFKFFSTEGDAAVDKRILLIPVEKGVHFIVCHSNSEKQYSTPVLVKRLINASKSKYLSMTKQRYGTKAGSVRLITGIVNLNTIYIPKLKNTACTSSREWSVGPIWGGYVLFPWDCLLLSMMISLESKKLAYYNALTILSQANKEGMIPGSIGKYLITQDRPVTPIESYCILKLYRRFREKAFLEKSYPVLKNSLQFYINKCDGNRDGLYEWGSFPPKLTVWQKESMRKINRLLPLGVGAGTLQGAKYASGMDNSPTFDYAEYDEKTHTMKMADIGLNSLLVLESECLQTMARILGYKRDATFLKDFHLELKKKIQDNLWDDKDGIYKSRTWTGEFVEALGPMNFYPLLAGIPDQKRAKRMVRKHLLNPDEFWGDYVIPTIARSHPSFQDQDYWRGRIWGSTNYLVYDGLRRYGFNRAATRLSCKSAILFLKEYKKDSHVHENYNAITGDGDDTNRIKGKIKSDAFYPWGALLLFMSLEKEKIWNVTKRER